VLGIGGGVRPACSHHRSDGRLADSGEDDGGDLYADRLPRLDGHHEGDQAERMDDGERRKQSP
jgi:hypothetical protein